MVHSTQHTRDPSTVEQICMQCVHLSHSYQYLYGHEEKEKNAGGMRNGMLEYGNELMWIIVVLY